MEIFVQLVLNSIIAGSIYAVMAIGFNLIFGTVKFFDLGYGALSAVGAYGVFLFAKKLSFPAIWAIVLGVFIAGLLSYVIYKFVYTPLREKKASNMVILVASLGVFTMLQALLAIAFTSQFQVLSSNAGTQTIYEIFGGVMTQTQVIILAVAVLLMLALGLVLKHTMFGKAVKAIGDNEEVSQIVGIDTKRIVGYVFMIGGAVAGLAGILSGFDTGIEPTMGMALLLKGVIASIIGGIGSVYGGVLGAFFLGFVENFGIWYISGEWKDAIAFALLIIFLLFRPQGILGKK